MYGRRVRERDRDAATVATAAAAAAVLLMAAVATAADGTHGRQQPPPPANDGVIAVPSSADADLRQPIADNLVGPTTSTRPVNESADGLKKVMWKRCMSKNYATCVKLALVHLVDRLEQANETYSLVPGVTLQSTSGGRRHDAATDDDRDDDGAAADGPASSAGGGGGGGGRDSSEALDRLFVDKLGRYFGTLTLNVKLLDDETARSVRKLGEAAAEVQSGRGKKQKYTQSMLLAGWVTGAMLLALGMKAIAVLAGKALMTALMSLLLSALASFRGHGHGHAEPKSTTYEIVTKPVYTHSHAAAAAVAADDAHAAASQNNPTYRRSIGGGLLQQALAPLVAATSASSEEADHVVYRIHASDKTPIYIPIERRRRRRR